MKLRTFSGLFFCSGLLAASTWVAAYPLDGAEHTGMRRLEAARVAQAKLKTLPPGALLLEKEVDISGVDGSELPPLDTKLSAALHSVLGNQAGNYGVAIVDLSDPENIRYAGHQPDYLANVGSVGKVLALLAWMQKLAELYPDDLQARERVLRETQIVSDEYASGDEHKVPIFDAQRGAVISRVLRPGDTGNLWEFMDWMLSASSNGAAAMVMKELAAIQHFGHDYPADQAARNQALKTMTAAERGKLLLGALLPPLVMNGFDPARLRQGSLFTSTGKNRMPGTNSYATPRDLVRLLTLIEAGKFVDPWSSTQAKRLLYMTQRRIRYASHPVLNPAAVYFKSGSLYSCMPEPNFVCRKYMGNKQNRLASIALIESPAGAPSYRYAVAVMSNVLRVNSAVAHQSLALRIHRLIESLHQSSPKTVEEKLPPARLEDAEGRGGDG